MINKLKNFHALFLYISFYVIFALMFNSDKPNLGGDEHMSVSTVGQMGFISRADYPYITDNYHYINLIALLQLLKSILMIVNSDLAQIVWAKGVKVPGKDEKEWRLDEYGALICFAEYGKQSKYGWEIDHIIPKSKGGSSDISNLQPLQWKNNRRKSDELFPIVTAYHGRNVENWHPEILFE